MRSTAISSLKKNRLALFSKAFLAATLSMASAPNASMADDGDWAQWRGPARDGIAAEQNLLKSWPEGGPKLAWKYESAGLGYSSSAVSNGRLYTMGQRGADTLAICLDAKTGKELWGQKIGPGTQSNDYLTGWGGGPRSTPTVDGTHAYFLSDLGDLACLSVADGSVVWSKNLIKDF